MFHIDILDKTFPLMKLFHYTFIYLCQYRIENNYTFYQNKTWFSRPIFFSLNSPWIFILYKIKKHVSYLPRNHTPLRRISIRDRIKLKCKIFIWKKTVCYLQPSDYGYPFPSMLHSCTNIFKHNATIRFKPNHSRFLLHE